MNKCIHRFIIYYTIFIYTAKLYLANECPSDHLCKGICQLVNGLKFCICKPGETNWDCKSSLDLCNKDCIINGSPQICSKLLCNKGTCINTKVPPFYNCNCGPFYTGQNCQIENNPCMINANPCANGICEFVYGINKINCHCKPGWKTRDSDSNYTIDWEGLKIIVDPPCLERAFYGISKIAPYLSPGQKVIWYIIFAVLSLLFTWQFYRLCLDIAKNKASKSKPDTSNAADRGS